VIDLEHSHDRRAPYVGVAIDEASGHRGGLRVTERGGDTKCEEGASLVHLGVLRGHQKVNPRVHGMREL